MSGRDRQKYLSAQTIDQDLLNWCHDNLEIRLEMVCEIETPNGTIYVSDRNKYVGSRFYEARMKFPVISRTIGDWLVGEIQFSTLELELSNVDGKFNEFLPGGESFGGWIGKSVVVKMGLGEAEGSYRKIFTGKVTEVGGFKRSVKSIKLIARDNYDFLNDALPNRFFSVTSYPDIEETYQGKAIPIIYGDWTVDIAPDVASVMAYPVNGNNAQVFQGTRNPVQFVVAGHALSYFDQSAVYLQRGDSLWLCQTVQNVSLSGASFEVAQGGTWFSSADGQPAPYEFQRGDLFLVKVKGKDLGAYSDNIVAQAKDILSSYSPAMAPVFHSTWQSFMDKASPSESAISSIKSRVWLQDVTPRLQYVLSMLEQVRLEAFINRDLALELRSLHFDDFASRVGPFTVKNWDVVKGTLEPAIDDKNNFNRAQGVFDFRPNRNENAISTRLHKNQAAINQHGKAISKKVVFPNLYKEQDVSNQLKEILKLSSATSEIVSCALTWRSLLLEVGQFVRLSVKIGSTIFDDVPCMIREIGYDPEGFKILVKMWSFQMAPFSSYQPGYHGTVGGSQAVITVE